MANEPIERVARAILKARFYDCEPHMYGNDVGRFFGEVDSELLCEARGEACAAIEEMGGEFEKARMQARERALDEAAEAVARHDAAGREWAPDSFWGQVTNEAVSRIRALKEKPE